MIQEYLCPYYGDGWFDEHNVMRSSKMSLNLKKNNNSGFIFSERHNFRAIVSWKSHQNWAYRSWDRHFSDAQKSKQSNIKEIECYYRLYLKINNSEFRLILLDHITLCASQPSYQLSSFEWVLYPTFSFFLTTVCWSGSSQDRTDRRFGGPHMCRGEYRAKDGDEKKETFLKMFLWPAQGKNKTLLARDSCVFRK